MDQYQELSEEEKNIIDKHRKAKALDSEKDKAKSIIISIAAQWDEYSKKTGRCLTYSEFCEGFCFEDRVDQKYHSRSNQIYSGVESVYKRLNCISIEIGSLMTNEKR